MDNMDNILVLAGSMEEFKAHTKELMNKYPGTNIRYVSDERFMHGLRFAKVELIGRYWLSKVFNSDCYRYIKCIIGEENISHQFAGEYNPPRVGRPKD